jgi:pilus assembly protein CpaB
MKNKRSVIIALVIAAFAFFAQYQYIENRIKNVLGPYEKLPVVISIVDIEKDKVIDESMIAMDQIPKKFVQPGSLQNIDEVLGRRAIVTIKKGTQLLSSSILKYKEAYLSYEIPDETRAVTVAVNDITGIAGLPRPGDFVDVIVTYDFGKREIVDKRTKTLFQNVQVLAMGRDIRKISTPFGAETEEQNEKIQVRNVTLALPLRQCQRIILAQELGLLSLVLREREEIPKLEEIPEDDIYSVTGTKEPLKPSEQPPYLEIRGRTLGY